MRESVRDASCWSKVSGLWELSDQSGRKRHPWKLLCSPLGPTWPRSLLAHTRHDIHIQLSHRFPGHTWKHTVSQPCWSWADLGLLNTWVGDFWEAPRATSSHINRAAAAVRRSCLCHRLNKAAILYMLPCKEVPPGTYFWVDMLRLDLEEAEKPQLVRCNITITFTYLTGLLGELCPCNLWTQKVFRKCSVLLYLEQTSKLGP